MTAVLKGTPAVTTFRARNGAHLVIRPMEATDTPALGRMWDRLSSETIYLRFMTSWPRGLTPAMIDHLTSVDHDRREVLVAVCRGEVVGVARYHVIAGREAEVAVMVEDAWQRQGISRALFTTLSALARSRGIEWFSGTMLADNHAAVGMLRSVAPGVRMRIEQGEIVFRFSTVRASSPQFLAAV